MDYDLIIVGLGPAGISAGLNASIRRKKSINNRKKIKSFRKKPINKKLFGL